MVGGGRVDVTREGRTWTVTLTGADGRVRERHPGFRNERAALTARGHLLRRHLEEGARPRELSAADVRAVTEAAMAYPEVRDAVQQYQQRQQDAEETQRLAAERVRLLADRPSTFQESQRHDQAMWDHLTESPDTGVHRWLREATAPRPLGQPITVAESSVTAEQLGRMSEAEQEAHRRAEWQPGGRMHEAVVAPHLRRRG